MCKYCKNWKNIILDEVHNDTKHKKLKWYDSAVIMNWGNIPYLYIDWPINQEACSVEISYCPWCGKKLE